MSGYWYDIENSIFGLARKMPQLEGLDSYKAAIEAGAKTFRGSLEFERLPPPLGV
jgi:hypothetical protein